MPLHTDPAHRETEQIIKEMESRLAKEYRQAYLDVSRKLDEYLKKFKTKDKIWKKWVAEGEKTEAEYKQWRVGQLAIGLRWSEMKRSLAQDLHHTNEMARSIVRNEYMPQIYAINHNYATFDVEKGSNIDTSYTLYDRDTVIRMMKDNPKLMPDPTPNSKVARDIAAGKDIEWNRQHIQSAMMQGILQGESIDKMATRLQSVTTADYKAAVRYARTMATSAQNAGRYAAYQRAEERGIDLSLVWEATLDERTRVSHRFLDSEVRDVNEPFEVDGVQIYYPGDLGGEDYKVPGYLIWNCRCTIIAQVKGFEYNTRSERTDFSQTNGEFEDWEEDYKNWKNAHESISNPIDRPKLISESIQESHIRRYGGFFTVNNGSSSSLSYSRLPSSEGAFSTIDGRGTSKQYDIIKPHNVIKDLNKTDTGKRALSLIEKNGTTVEFVYGVDNVRGGYEVVGVYDPSENKITIFADFTKSIKETAATVVHEAFHLDDFGACRKSEVYCEINAMRHKKHDDLLTFGEIKSIMRWVNKDYSELPWR